MKAAILSLKEFNEKIRNKLEQNNTNIVKADTGNSIVNTWKYDYNKKK
jgi:hypothetical protein